MSWLWLESSIKTMILITKSELIHDLKDLGKVSFKQYLLMNFNFCGLKHNDSMKIEAPPSLLLLPLVFLISGIMGN